MRHRGLHDALKALTEQVAWQLAHDTAEGADVPFELVEEPGSRSPLYCYKPLTDQFIRGRAGELSRLPTWPPAAQALEALGGLEPYLRLRGEAAPTGREAEPVLEAFLARVFHDVSEFDFDEERFARAYDELERTLLETRTMAVVAAPLRGLAIASPEVALGEGLALVRADGLVDPPAELARLARDERHAGDAMAVLTCEVAPGEPPPLTAARTRFRKLVTALRLFEPLPFTLGPGAWARIDAGAWQLVSLGTGGRPPTEVACVEPEAEDELRAFCNLVARRMPAGPGRGELAWALGRFEMGCERLAPFEALTDHLLALRALLEPEGPGSGRLARRLAALCAVPADRAALAERVAHAISLERAVIGGLPPAEPGVDALVAELADHLRALLRDVLCGHLDHDLVQVAEDALADEAAAEAAALEAASTEVPAS